MNALPTGIIPPEMNACHVLTIAYIVLRWLNVPCAIPVFIYWMGVAFNNAQIVLPLLLRESALPVPVSALLVLVRSKIVHNAQSITIGTSIPVWRSALYLTIQILKPMNAKMVSPAGLCFSLSLLLELLSPLSLYCLSASRLRLPSRHP